MPSKPDPTALRLEIVDALAIVTMDSPPVNALGPTFLSEFEAILAGLDKARALLLRSACPGVFSAGDDVSELGELDAAVLAKLPRAHALLDAIEALPIPTVAAINGHALGGGLELALVFDFRLMARGDGRVGLPEARLGMIPALGGTQRLPRMVGRAKALEMMIKGRRLAADEAVSIGLVNAAYEADELAEKALDFGKRLSRQATGAIAHIKRAMSIGERHGFAKGMEAERAAFYENIRTPDAREGVRAFLAGEAPQFTGNRETAS